MIPLGFVAQTLSQKGIILDYYFLFWDKVSQIFLPKTMGNNTMPCGFVYVIAPQVTC